MPVTPLDPKEFRKSLGPGYEPGWYAWKGLRGRIDNCFVQNYNASVNDHIDKLYKRIQDEIYVKGTYEEYVKFIESYYHNFAHSLIGKACTYFNKNETKEADGIMAFSEASARDPIFYRWHSHLDDVVQQYRDLRLKK